MSVWKTILNIFLLFVFYLVFVSSVQAASSSTTLYFGDHEKILDQSGEVLEEKTYLALPHVMVLKKDGEVFYLHQDHLSSTRLITDSQGNKVEEYDYYPYGQLASLQLVNPLTTNKLYTSQTLDPSTNLYYYHARYYNPTTAHFLSADSAEGPNRYAYVSGNPISRNDPSGNQRETYLPMIYSPEGSEITIGQFLAAFYQGFIAHPFTLDIGGTWQNIEAKKEETWRNVIGDEGYEKMIVGLGFFKEGMSIASYTGTLGVSGPTAVSREYAIQEFNEALEAIGRTGTKVRFSSLAEREAYRAQTGNDALAVTSKLSGDISIPALSEGMTAGDIRFLTASMAHEFTHIEQNANLTREMMTLGMKVQYEIEAYEALARQVYSPKAVGFASEQLDRANFVLSQGYLPLGTKLRRILEGMGYASDILYHTDSLPVRSSSWLWPGD